MEADLRGLDGDKTAKARKVGELVAERAKAAGVDAVVFDRGWQPVPRPGRRARRRRPRRRAELLMILRTHTNAHDAQTEMRNP